MLWKIPTVSVGGYLHKLKPTITIRGTIPNIWSTIFLVGSAYTKFTAAETIRRISGISLDSCRLVYLTRRKNHLFRRSDKDACLDRSIQQSGIFSRRPRVKIFNFARKIPFVCCSNDNGRNSLCNLSSKCRLDRVIFLYD